MAGRKEGDKRLSGLIGQPPTPPAKFAAPSGAGVEDAELSIQDLAASAAGAVAELTQFADMPTSLLDAKGALEDVLRHRPERVAAGAPGLDSFQEGGNVQGVGIGLAEQGGVVGQPLDAAPGEPTLTVFTVEPTPVDVVRSVVVDGFGVAAAASNDVKVTVVPTGIIEAFPHRFMLKPAPGGVSTGHINITAGTLGCLAFGRTSPRNSRVLILSNNHVLANTNKGAYGDCIAQPGPADGGACPGNQVAILERFVPIVFGGSANYVDCATAWAWPDRVRKELVYLSGGVPNYFRISNTPVAPYLGMPVGKSGRTTQVTSGRITAIGSSAWINFGGSFAWFQDQLSIQAYSGDFSLPGDSGSSIWTWNSSRNPVGLLFAGGGGVTFANRIHRVMAALDIWLYT